MLKQPRHSIVALVVLLAAGTLLFGQRADVPSLGDAARGKVVFEGKGNCLSCHRVNDNGSRFGPDLSAIGAPGAAGPRGGPPAAPLNLAQLQRSILDPNAEVAPANRTYRAVKNDGTVINGKLLNQDTFNVALFDTNERLISLDRSTLREFTVVDSPMPSYRDKLSSQELADLLGYLASLKGGK